MKKPCFTAVTCTVNGSPATGDAVVLRVTVGGVSAETVVVTSAGTIGAPQIVCACATELADARAASTSLSSM